VSKRQCNPNQKRLVVNVRQVDTPDGNARLRQAIGILLKAAARNAHISEDDTNTEKKQPPCHGADEDAPTGGAEENKSHESA